MGRNCEVSESVVSEATEVLGMDPEVLTLLKEEYFHLQKTVEDFDQRTLTIKAWSVTTSMAGIAASFLHSEHSAALSLLAALASLSFWMTEALWKEFQQCYYPRIRALERAFSTGDTTEVPFQINKSWSETFHSYDLKRFIQVFIWTHVMFPHVFIVIGGVVIWIIRLYLLHNF
jgi:hypothetical protein